MRTEDEILSGGEVVEIESEVEDGDRRD